MHADKITLTTEESRSRRGEERLDAQAIFRARDLFLCALLETQADDGEPQAIDDKPEDRGDRRARGPHADGHEDAAEHLGALVQTASAEHLLGGGTRELQLLIRRRIESRFEISLR